MAEGIRIVHDNPRYAGSVVVVPTFRRYGAPMLCSTCQIIHETKHYHLQLDSEGGVIVSPTILQRLRDIGMAGFRVESSVADPPTQQVSMQQKPTRRELMLLSEALRGIVPPGAKAIVSNGGVSHG